MSTFKGISLRSGAFERSIKEAVLEKVRSHWRERLGAIRLPTTGEFPTVRFEGDTPEDLQAWIEGSPELIAHMKSVLGPEGSVGLHFSERADAISTPKVFLSYGWEDRELAKLIAQTLVANGIHTWWAEWEINYGDSLRQKIDAGLSNCTHFIVLLTPVSVTKPWVNQEMDAGLIRKIEDKRGFIPLRHQLPVNQLPPLIRGTLSPEVNAQATDLNPLIQQIHGIHRRPALGVPPPITRVPQTEYSAAATAVAQVIVKEATHGYMAEVQFSMAEMAEKTALAEEDAEDAIYELRRFFIPAGQDHYAVKDAFYAAFDGHFMGFHPAEDALRLAADLANDDAFPGDPRSIAERYGWEPRRLNSAITYLAERDVVHTNGGIGTAPFVTGAIVGTADTRRFVKSRN